VIYAYEQALLCLGYMPDIWYEAAFFQQQAAQRLAEKGDVKLSTAMLNEVIRMLHYSQITNYLCINIISRFI
jgi:cleavage stimulation factor subunit 3